MNANTITTGEVRLSYVNVFEPQARAGSTDAKYSLTVLVPKSDTATKAAMDTAIQAAIEQGVSKCWSGIRPPQPAICVHDGDGPRPSDGMPYGAECRGCWVFTASSKNAPGIRDINLQPIIDPREVYSGVWGRVNISFFAYGKEGKKGIGCGLNHIQKLRDGDPLVDRVSADEAFGAAAPAGYPAYGQPPAPAAPVYPPQATFAPPAQTAYQPQPSYNPFAGFSQ